MVKCNLEWKVSSEVSFEDMRNGLTLDKFSNEVDCNRVFEGPLWFMGGQLFSLQKWKKEFDPVKEPLLSALLWDRAPRLLLKFGLNRPWKKNP